MRTNPVSESRLARASEIGRTQRSGSGFVGGNGTKSGDSDPRFIGGQFPEQDGRITGNEALSTQLEHCLRNLETHLHRHGQGWQTCFGSRCISPIWLSTLRLLGRRTICDAIEPLLEFLVRRWSGEEANPNEEEETCPESIQNWTIRTEAIECHACDDNDGTPEY